MSTSSTRFEHTLTIPFDPDGFDKSMLEALEQADATVLDEPGTDAFANITIDELAGVVVDDADSISDGLEGRTTDTGAIREPVAYSAEEREAILTRMFENRRLLCFIAMSRLRLSADTADDLVQDTYVRAVQAVNGGMYWYNSVQQENKWLSTILVNTHLNNIARANRRPKATLVDTDVLITNLASGSATLEGLGMPFAAQQADGPQAHGVLKWLATVSMTARQRQAVEMVTLREVEGWSYEEIAGSMGVSVGDVSGGITKARKHIAGLLLRKEMAEETPVAPDITSNEIIHALPVELTDMLGAIDTSEEDVAIAQDIWNRLNPNGMSDSKRSMCVLYLLYSTFGQRYVDIAKLTGLPIGTVQSRIYRGKKIFETQELALIA